MDWKSILWFKSYLSDRKQFVRDGNRRSDVKNINVGVPQGSNLGPLLLTIYLNDFLELHIDGDIVCFADDCTVVFSADTYGQLQEKMQSALNDINKWMSDNRLKLNSTKTNCMFIDNSGRQTTDLVLTLNGNTISRVKSTKVLGIVVDERIAFKSHIDYICSQLSKRVGLLSRLSYFVPKPTLNLVYKAIVQPLIDYGLPVYGFTYETHTNRIQKLQNRAARVICKTDDSYSVLFSNLNWKPFAVRRNYFSSIFIFRCCKDWHQLNVNRYSRSKVVLQRPDL